MQYVVIVGDPVLGLKFFGPFEDADEAMTWADQEHDDQSWWVADMEMPA